MEMELRNLNFIKMRNLNFIYEETEAERGKVTHQDYTFSKYEPETDSQSYPESADFLEEVHLTPWTSKGRAP